MPMLLLLRFGISSPGSKRAAWVSCAPKNYVTDILGASEHCLELAILSLKLGLQLAEGTLRVNRRDVDIFDNAVTSPFVVSCDGVLGKEAKVVLLYKTLQEE